MAPSLDFGLSSLLCVEEDSSIFNEEIGLEEFEANTTPLKKRQHDDDLLFSDNDIPMQSDECLGLMIKTETDHLPATEYFNRLINGDLDLEARNQAIHWITKVHAHFNFGPLCAYLSINYLDRFLSAYELPKGNNWMMHLLAIACLSLAAKVEETEVPLSLDLQVGESKFVFEAKTIQRMELRVLSTLKWRMQAITPFSYLDYFLGKINPDQRCSGSLVLKSTQLILNASRGIEFLEFKPSEIAAAVAISVVGETQIVDTEKAISSLIQLVSKERVMKCVELIKEVDWSGSSTPQSPIGVLEAGACLSYTSDDVIVESCANSSQTCTKRRKLNLPFELYF